MQVAHDGDRRRPASGTLALEPDHLPALEFYLQSVRWPACLPKKTMRRRAFGRNGGGNTVSSAFRARDQLVAIRIAGDRVNAASGDLVGRKPLSKRGLRHEDELVGRVAPRKIAGGVSFCESGCLCRGDRVVARFTRCPLV